MKYIELGFGNRWVIRTETEREDGSEYEEKGIVGPVKFHSLYLRIWINETVYVLDLKEGYKKMKKNRKAFKLVLGVVSD